MKIWCIYNSEKIVKDLSIWILNGLSHLYKLLEFVCQIFDRNLYVIDFYILLFKILIYILINIK